MKFVATEIMPFAFPTTVMLVDDHAEFLQSLQFGLDPSFHCAIFESPRMALQSLQSRTNAVALQQWMFKSREQESDSKPLMSMDLKGVQRLIYDMNRFAEPAVIVVDYSMPEMDGLEFCEQVNNPLIGKILLTGKADERIAVKAFNGGLIDRFVRKSDAGALETLNSDILSLRQRFFARASQQVRDALELNQTTFLRDPAFIELFAGLKYKFSIIEHYFCCAPTGVLMVNARGKAWFLLVQSEDDVRSLHEQAEDFGADLALCTAIRGREQLAWFFDSDGQFDPSMGQDFKRYLFPANELAPGSQYSYAVIESPAPFAMQHAQSYARWLDEQDRLEEDRRATNDRGRASHLSVVR
jgi:CheY-like chemotaxis protein